MDVRQLTLGLWRWTAPHPNHWPEHVGCVYYEAPDAVVLIDPLLPAGEEEEFLAYLDRDVERLGLPVAILLTAPWHRRSAYQLMGRYGAVPWAHEAGHARLAAPARSGPLPGGVEAFALGGDPEGQVAFFIRPHRALVVAEIFTGDGRGGLKLCPSPALIDRAALDKSLQSLLELPVELVLVSHGEPVLEHGVDAMRLALSESLPA